MKLVQLLTFISLILSGCSEKSEIEPAVSALRLNAIEVKVQYPLSEDSLDFQTDDYNDFGRIPFFSSALGLIVSSSMDAGVKIFHRMGRMKFPIYFELPEIDTETVKDLRITRLFLTVDDKLFLDTIRDARKSKPGLKFFDLLKDVWDKAFDGRSDFKFLESIIFSVSTATNYVHPSIIKKGYLTGTTNEDISDNEYSMVMRLTHDWLLDLYPQNEFKWLHKRITDTSPFTPINDDNLFSERKIIGSYFRKKGTQARGFKTRKGKVSNMFVIYTDNARRLASFLKKKFRGKYVTDAIANSKQVFVEMDKTLTRDKFDFTNFLRIEAPEIFASDNSDDRFAIKFIRPCTKYTCIEVEINDENLLSLIANKKELRIETYVQVDATTKKKFRIKGFLELTAKVLVDF